MFLILYGFSMPISTDLLLTLLRLMSFQTDVDNQSRLRSGTAKRAV